MKLLCLVFVAAIYCSCNSSKKIMDSMQDNTLSAQEKKEGWRLLFDGSTTRGWHTYGYPSVTAAWIVQDGSLHIDTSTRKSWTNESKDILADEEFDNFHFKADWKISKKGNSGIIFYVNENKAKYGETYYTGPEMQVIDNAGHADAKIPKHRAGDLYDLISSSSEPVKPAGEWNHAEIVANKGKLDLYLNGVHIVSTTMWNDTWNQLVAGSKFKSMADFGKYKIGRIALQAHGDEVSYKNIKIRKL